MPGFSSEQGMSEESAGRWSAGTSLGEGIAVATLLGLLVMFAATSLHGALSRFKVLEAIELSAGDKSEWMEHWALTGSWPMRASPDSVVPVSVLPKAVTFLKNHYVDAKREDVADGNLGYHFAAPRVVTLNEGLPFNVGDAALQGYSVGIRPAFAPGETPTSVVWLCGYAEPPPGFVAPTKNLTDVPAALLPSPCRAPLKAER
jgi:hypothetical protein